MIIYSSTHPGATLDDASLANLNLQFADLRGYFQKDQLRTLMNNNPSCVGIRFYNVNPSNEFPALLAVCVLENGADIKDDDTPTSIKSHMLGKQINKADQPAQGLNRRDALDEIKLAYSFGVDKSEKFSAYFSKTMLEKHFDNTEDVGISFYKIIWLTGNSTLIAISSNLDSVGTPVIGASGTAFTNCISDQPCPGHCVNKNAKGEDILASTPMISTPGDLDSHYIPIWD